MQKNFTPIRTKITASILVSALLLAILVLGASSNFLLKSYLEIEKDTAERNMARVHAALQNRLSYMEVSLADWANWNDTYQFAQDRNEAYIESNLQASSQVNLGLNIFMLLDTEGTMIYGNVVDLVTEEAVTDDTALALLESLRRKVLLGRADPETVYSGAFLVTEGVVLLAASPISDNEGAMPTAGTLIFGRFLDQSTLEEIREISQVSFEIFPYTSVAESGTFQFPIQELESGTEFYTNAASKDTLDGYSLLLNPEGVPAGLIVYEIDRQIYSQGSTTIAIFVLASSLAILLLALIVGFLLNHFIIARFTRLSQEVEDVSKTKNLDSRVSVGPMDEIGRLATIINQMFAELAEAQETRRKFQELERDATKTLQKRMRDTEEFNKLMVGRELKMIELKSRIRKLEKEHDEDVDG